MGLWTKIINLFKPANNIVSFSSGYSTSSAPWRRDAWEQDIFRATVDTIATYAAKGQVKHVVLDENGRIKKEIFNSQYAKLLNVRPNPIMTATEFKYKMFAQLETKTTAIAYIKWNGTIPEMVIPVDYNNFTIYPLKGGGYCIEVMTFEGEQQYFMMEDCIVLRKFYNSREASGDGNEPIYQVLDMSKASDEGFIESLQTANKIRGLLKNKMAQLDPEDVRKSQEEFSRRFAEAAEHGGVVGIDSSEEFVPISATQYSASNTQMAHVANRIYTYLRTPEEIVQGKYSESVGMAWHEGKIEPLWQMLSEALTNAFFTVREKDVGNRLIVAGGVAMGTSYTTRVQLIGQTKELGILTINEQRELLGYAPIEGGDKRLVSLNFVDADKQNEYQLGEKNE